MEKSETEDRLDGNAAAGTLQAIFPFDMTQVDVTCANCESTSPMGATAAYMSKMGTIMRCPSCNSPLIRVVHVKGRNLIDLRGVQVLQIKTA